MLIFELSVKRTEGGCKIELGGVWNLIQCSEFGGDKPGVDGTKSSLLIRGVNSHPTIYLTGFVFPKFSSVFIHVSSHTFDGHNCI